MKKRLLILLSAALAAVASPCYGASLVTVRVQITNAPSGNSQTFTLQSQTRTWTNDVSTSPGTLILITNTIANSVTNLFLHLSSHPVFEGHELEIASAERLDIHGFPDEAMSASAAGNWAVISYGTNDNVGDATYVVRVPPPESANVQTNIATRLVSYIEQATNTFSPTSRPLSNYLALTTAQVVSGAKVHSGANLYSNATQLYYSGSLSNVSLWATNGLLTAVSLSNCTGTLRGIYVSNVIAHSIVATNFSAPGAGADSIAIGGTASGDLATQIGDTGAAGGRASFAGGYFATAGGTNSVAVGAAAEVLSLDGVGVGQNVGVFGAGGVAIGKNSTISEQGTNSVAILASSSAPYEIRLGGADHTFHVAGWYIGAAISNTVTAGTNHWGGDLSMPANIISSLANGANTITPVAGALLIRFTGGITTDSSLDGITGYRDGLTYLLENGTGYNLTLRHNSGSEATPANRLWNEHNNTNAVMIHGASALIQWQSTLNRWKIKGVWPEYHTATNRLWSADSTEFVELTHSGAAAALTTKATSGNIEPLLLQTGAGAGAGQITLNTNGTTKVSGTTMFGATATTSGVITTNLYTFTPAISSAYSIWIQVAALESGLTEAAFYVVESAFRVDAGGVVTEVGADAAIATQEDVAAWACTVDTSGGLIRVRVVGDTGDTVSWRVTGRITVTP